ncbi:unnamed protein product [Paramecium primaurelia]|uniref:Uncharacterized protein n=1 Tax=Paramecium primaurelia TaxID=5886 RepID=A0A8S1M9W7_PARPR|nr:unnamed protein product [Paramecium primaurelia]
MSVYFNFERVQILLKWAYNNFSKVTILDFTELWRKTLTSQGIDIQKQNEKVKKQEKAFNKNVKMAIKSVLQEKNPLNDLEMEKIWSDLRKKGANLQSQEKFLISKVEDFYNNQAYLNSVQILQEAANKSSTLNSFFQEFTLSKILNIMNQNQKKLNINFAMDYFIRELPFFLNGKEIFGVESVFVYHKEFSPYYRILNGEFSDLGLGVSNGSGFARITLINEENQQLDSSIKKSAIQEITLENLQLDQNKKKNKNFRINQAIKEHFSILGDAIVTSLMSLAEQGIAFQAKNQQIKIWIEESRAYKNKTYLLIIQLKGLSFQLKTQAQVLLSSFLGTNITFNVKSNREQIKLSLVNKSLANLFSFDEINNIIAGLDDSTNDQFQQEFEHIKDSQIENTY